MPPLRMPRLRGPRSPPIPPIPRISRIPRKKTRKSQKQRLRPFQSIRIPTATRTATPRLRTPRLRMPRLRTPRLRMPRLRRPRLRYSHAYATLGPSRPHEKEENPTGHGPIVITFLFDYYACNTTPKIPGFCELATLGR
ncbi:hypothetical protein C8034_v005381 [Colletotrichum sidae]|uniref:Uncharacterized protein n=1 Tax=Colletotrichum sidae TaxID=1347389 RepID=A0A4R8RMM5_9PEZI|nr:hypothetical protein C8034_v005381 [Colletotrichum sidae]